MHARGRVCACLCVCVCHTLIIACSTSSSTPADEATLHDNTSAPGWDMEKRQRNVPAGKRARACRQSTTTHHRTPCAIGVCHVYRCLFLLPICPAMLAVVFTCSHGATRCRQRVEGPLCQATTVCASKVLCANQTTTSHTQRHTVCVHVPALFARRCAVLPRSYVRT